MVYAASTLWPHSSSETDAAMCPGESAARTSGPTTSAPTALSVTTAIISWPKESSSRLRISRPPKEEWMPRAARSDDCSACRSASSMPRAQRSSNISLDTDDGDGDDDDDDDDD